MQFYEDTKYYHFSRNPVTDEEERAEIISEGIEDFKEMMTSSLKPEASLGNNIIKYGALGIFAGAVALCFYFSKSQNVPGILFTLGALCIFFGILFLIPSNEKPRDLPGRAKLPKALGFGLLLSFGLAIIIPAIIAPSFGYAKATAGGIAAFFLICGLSFAVYTIYGIIRQKRTSGQTVSGTCIGYIKMVDSTGGMNNSSHHQVLITATPVFEYTCNGQTYKAFQEDDMRSGKMTTAVGETKELTIDPDDPYTIFYRKNTTARIFAFVMSLLALGAGIFIICMMPNINDDGGFAVNTMGGQVRLAQAKFDDKTIAKYIQGDYTISYATVESIYQVEDFWAMDLSDGSKIRLDDEGKKKYYEGAGIYVVKPVDGGPGFNFSADEWVYAGDHEVKGLPG